MVNKNTNLDIWIILNSEREIAWEITKEIKIAIFNVKVYI